MKTPSKDHLLLAMTILLFVALSATYSVVVPTYESPDEASHLDYALYILRNRQFVDLRQPSGINNDTTYEPPLFSVLVATAAWLVGLTREPTFRMNSAFPSGSPFLLLHGPEENFPFSEQIRLVHVLRLVTIPFGALTVFITYETALLVFPSRKNVALFAAMLNAFIPQFTFLSGMIINDILATFLSSLAIFLTLRILLSHENSLSSAIVLGIVTGLAFLSKYPALPVGLAILLALVIAPERRKRLRTVLSFILAVSLVSGWWYVRNIVLYHDLTGIYELARPGSGYLYESQFKNVPFIYYLLNFHFDALFSSFFGRLGWQTFYSSPTVYSLFYILFGAGLLGAIGIILDRSDKPKRSLLLFLFSVPILLLVTDVIFSFSIPEPQGRYLFPGISAICVLVALGYTRIFPQHGASTRVALGSIVVFVLVVNLSFIARFLQYFGSWH